MKKIFFIIFIIFLCSCLSNNKEDSDFKKCMKIVKDYDNLQQIESDTVIARFIFATEYLQRATNIKASYIFADVPHYNSRKDCKSDLRKWRKWYDTNGSSLTQERSDSLKREIAKDNIWWNDSTILQYVFEIE